MTLLILSLLALAGGPLLYPLARGRPGALAAIDGFVLTVVTGLVVLMLVPEAMLEGGPWVVVFASIGLLAPSLLERAFHHAEERTHRAALVLALVGLALHTMLDGAALTSADGDSHHDALALAVILHRFPVGVAIWWLLRPAAGLRISSLVLGAFGLATAAGFFLGPELLAPLEGRGLAWFQALVAGSLLHVVFHRHPTEHDHQAGHGHHRHGAADGPHWPEGAGALIGMAFLFLVLEGELFAEQSSVVGRVVATFFDLALISAPALLLGYLMAGLVSSLLPDSAVRWMARGGSWSQSLRGMLIGLPVPICSCGVVPVYRGLIGRRVPPAAALAFLIATPELGLDALLLSLPLLGTSMTLLRVGGAALVALMVGALVGRWVANSQEGTPTQPLRFKVSFAELVDHTAPWILLGIVVAALVEPLLGTGMLTHLPPGTDVILLTLVGMPTYVCASGATPFVAVLLAAGVSPGAALAFLLVGPATNVTTFGVLTRLHGKRVAGVFSIVIVAVSVTLGYAVNQFLPSVRGPLADPTHVHGGTPLQWVCLSVLTAIYAWAMLRQGVRGFFASLALST